MIDEAKEYDRIIQFLKLTVDESIIRDRYRLDEEKMQQALDITHKKQTIWQKLCRADNVMIALDLLISVCVKEPRGAIFAATLVPSSIYSYVMYRRNENYNLAIKQKYAHALQKISEEENEITFSFNLMDPKQLKDIKGFMDNYDAMTEEQKKEFIQDILNLRYMKPTDDMEML